MSRSQVAPEGFPPVPAGSTSVREGEHEIQVPACGVRLFLKPKLILSLLKAALLRADHDKVPRMGAALAYYTIFSLAPVLIISISVAGVFFGAEAVRGEISRQMEGLTNLDNAKAIEAVMQSASRPAPSAMASALGVLVLLIGASGVFVELYDALNSIWGVQGALHSGIWTFLKARILSFGMVLAIGFLLIVSGLVSGVLAALGQSVESSLNVPVVFLHFLDFLFSTLFIATLFALIFKLLPEASISWTEAWVGAILTSLLFTIGKIVIGFYIGKSVTASFYGVAGSLVIIVAWIYYSAQIFYFGAEFTRIYALACRPHSDRQPLAIP